MLRKIKKYLLLSLIALVALSAFRLASGLFHATEGKIAFRSDAPMELIRASSNSLVGIIDTSRKQFSFKVPVSSFEGFNSKTQREHFNENYMQTDRFPEASFKGKIIEDIDFSQEGTHTVRAKGMLNIHGVEKERIIRSDLVIKKNMVNLQSSFTVLLSDHNIPIPKVVHQKLANEIRVEVNTTLQPR